MLIQKASAQMMAQSPPVGQMGPGMMGHGTMMGNLGMMGPMMMGNRNFTGMMNPGMMAAAPNVTGSSNISYNI